MMKTDVDKMVFEEEQQILSFEESIPGSPTPEITAQEDEQEVDLGQIVNDSEALLEIITEQARLKRIWQIATACLMIFVVLISFICTGLYMESKKHIEKFSQAQVSFQRANNDFTKAAQKVKTFENQLGNSKAELKRVQEDLKSSKSETENLQNLLADTNRRFEALQNRNAAAVKRLNERLQKLSD